MLTSLAVGTEMVCAEKNLQYVPGLGQGRSACP